jgi:Leucine-rich repeat (LRR) protein
MVVFLLFCLCFWAGAFAQEKAGNQLIFKVICEIGTGVEFECTVEEDCSSTIQGMGKKIKLIDDETLPDCVGVEDLNLQQNEINEISKNAFRDQQNLRWLFLNKNQIKLLTPGVFDPLTNLTHLALSDNLIEAIEDSLFEKNSKLEQIYLNQNEIVAVGPNAIQHLSNLRFLALFGNPCMYPYVTLFKNAEYLGVFSYSGAGNQKWNNREKTCVSWYVEKYYMKNLQQKLIDAEKTSSDCDSKYETLSGTSENCNEELSETRARIQNCQETVKNLQNELTENQNDQVMTKIVESERKKT